MNKILKYTNCIFKFSTEIPSTKTEIEINLTEATEYDNTNIVLDTPISDGGTIAIKTIDADGCLNASYNVYTYSGTTRIGNFYTANNGTTKHSGEGYTTGGVTKLRIDITAAKVAKSGTIKVIIYEPNVEES